MRTFSRQAFRRATAIVGLGLCAAAMPVCHSPAAADSVSITRGTRTQSNATAPAAAGGGPRVVRGQPAETGSAAGSPPSAPGPIDPQDAGLPNDDAVADLLRSIAGKVRSVTPR